MKNGAIVVSRCLAAHSLDALARHAFAAYVQRFSPALAALPPIHSVPMRATRITRARIMTRSHMTRASLALVALLVVPAAALWTRRPGPSVFHASDVARLAATGRPQLVKFFGRA